jgi:hypothetical protein
VVAASSLASTVTRTDLLPGSLDRRTRIGQSVRVAE